MPDRDSHVMCGVGVMTVIDLSVVNVALPSIQADLIADSADLQWVVVVYGVFERRFYEDQLGLVPGEQEQEGVRHFCAEGTSIFVYVQPDPAGASSATLAGRTVDFAVIG